MLNDKTILVTGGTGSFGRNFIDYLLKTYHCKKIIVFSRDELKQHQMRVNYRDESLHFVIGDIRDRDSIEDAMYGVDYVFHAAALKQVPSCEFYPLEAVKTNILGSQNVLDTAEKQNVKKVVVLSTDKAVYPINAMGISKAMVEKLVLAKVRNPKSDTVFCAVRYGNVMCSRGSIIPLFIDQIKAGKELTVTNPDMTRFLLPLPQAVELVAFALENGTNGDLFVRKSPASTVEILAKSLLELFHAKNVLKVIGVRRGEKMHETLVTQEELARAQEFDQYYRVIAEGSVDYEKYFTEGFVNSLSTNGYTSANTTQLDIDKTKDLLLSLSYVKDRL